MSGAKKIIGLLGRICLYILSGAVLLGLLTFLTGLSILNQTGIQISELNGLPLDFNPPLITDIYDRSGNLLAQLYEEKRYFCELEDIPQVLVDALLSCEDKNFWTHRGIDLQGMIRALFVNLRQGEVEQGGSTITQQLARSLYLSSEVTLKRKISEIILALRLEKTYSKEEILQMYLNEVYFGHGAYGVEAASLGYFGLHVNELNLPQSALLAGLIAAPSRFCPYLDFDLAKERQRVVLERMVENGKISQAEAEEAFAYPLQLEYKLIQPRRAPYFVDWIQGMLIDLLGEKETFCGGLRVYTSLDSNLQLWAEQAVQEGVAYWQEQGVWPKDLYDKLGVTQPQASLVAIDPKTGDVLAMVGGTDYSQTQYNRTIAARQAGSAFKIFVYSTAFEEKTLKPSDILVSEPIDINGWSPSEYRENPFQGKRYYGELTVREAIVRSSNVAAVKVAMKTGLDKIIETAKKMGITTPLSPVPSLSIGAIEVKPLEMAQAYGVLAQGGEKDQLRPILKIEDYQGKTILEFPTSAERVLSPQTAWQMTDYFRSVIKTSRAYIPELPSAGKTGTTDFFQDAWFCGYTPSCSTVVWTGPDSSSVGFVSSYNIGMLIPASIWKNFMEKAMTALPLEDFTPP